MRIVSRLNVTDDTEVTMVVTRREMAMIAAALGEVTPMSIMDSLHKSIKNRNVEMDDYWENLGERLEVYLNETA